MNLDNIVFANIAIVNMILRNHIISVYNNYLETIKLSNKSKELGLSARHPNFPSEISEYLAKRSLMKAWNLDENEITKKKKQSGDLVINYSSNIFHKIEVKCFSSNGPISFGPTEYWDYLMLIDARQNKRSGSESIGSESIGSESIGSESNGWDNLFYVYLVDSDSDSPIIKNIKVNKKETFADHCKQKRRPRIRPNELIKQLENNIKILERNTLVEIIK